MNPEEHYFHICNENEKNYEVLRLLFCAQVKAGDTTCDEEGLEITRQYLQEIEGHLSSSYFRYCGIGDQDGFETFLRKACMYCVNHYPVSKKELDNVINKI